MPAKKTEARAAKTAADGAFVITRVFDAPRDLVWKAWAEPERLAQWWGPKGCAISIVKLEFRPGGLFHYAMQYSSGAAMWGRFAYREIAAPERIVWLNSFAGEKGEVIRAPFAQSFPIELLNTVALSENAGRTTLTLRATPHEATEEERRFFAGFFDSLEKGFGGTFDQLAAYLAKAAPNGAARDASDEETSMRADPQNEHEWLQRLVGDWTYEGECDMGPGKPRSKSSGFETVRPLGGLWVLAEGQGTMPGGGPANTLMTLGFDPRTKRYTGTWIGSMMTHLWVYDGETDAGDRVLTLDCEGPSMSGDGLAKYQDVIEIVSGDHRILTARIQEKDGAWRDFMTTHYRRKS